MQHTKKVVRVASCTHGLGVYAERGFAAGECIGPFQGEILDDPEYGSDYGIDMGDSTLEPAPPFRYLNHSCQPNCALVILDEEEDGSPCGPGVWLETLRDIKSGEQMTIDYAWPADAAIPCGCGAASCRGWIVSAEGLADVVRVQDAAAMAS